MKRPKRVAMGMFSVVPAVRQHRGWHLIWIEDGKLFTTCAGCNRLISRDDGPRCGACVAKSAAPARMRRRRWKLDRARTLAGDLQSDPRPRASTATLGLSVNPATRHGPSGTSGSRIGEGAFGRTGSVKSNFKVAQL